MPAGFARRSTRRLSADQVRSGRAGLPGWRDVLRSRNRPVGAPVAQLFSQLMSSTGLAFCIPASSIAQPHRTIGIDRECRAPAEGHP
jgi:hypothetical protein